MKDRWFAMAFIFITISMLLICHDNDKKTGIIKMLLRDKCTLLEENIELIKFQIECNRKHTR
jgi:hypothetical protein